MNDDNVINLKDFQFDSKNSQDYKETPPELPKSNLGKRCIAFCIDILSVMILKAAVATSYALFVNDYMIPLSKNQKLVLINGNFALNAAVFVALYYSYFLFTHYVLNGRSIGKLTMSLRTINDEFIYDKDSFNTQITFTIAAKRALGYLICYFSFGTFFIFNFSSEDKRGFADFISSSRTVDEKWLKSRIQHKKHCAEEVTIDVYSLNQVA